MPFLSTEYCYKDKSNWLKFIDDGNKNLYKLMNGRKCKIVSGNVVEKSYLLKGCKKVIVLIKCMFHLPLLAVTLVLKITNKENKLAEKKFEALRQKKATSFPSQVSKTLSAKMSTKTTFVFSNKEFSKSATVVGRGPSSHSTRRAMDSSQESLAISLGYHILPLSAKMSETFAFVSSSSVGLQEGTSHSTQMANASCEESSAILLEDHKLPSAKISLQDSETSSAFQSAKTHLSEKAEKQKNEEQSAPSTFASFFTKTAVPAAISGVNYAAKWAVNQLIKDGLVYGASALTGIPPGDFKYGMQMQKAADTNGWF